MKNWPQRYIYTLALFLLGVLVAIINIIGMKTYPGSVGPGSGLGILAPFAGAIFGYALGGVIDIFSRK